MDRRESLRGPDAFQRVFRSGRKLEGRLLYCYFLVDSTTRASLQVGFSVPSRLYSAVRRNRVKRLMREAFRAQRGSLLSALQDARASMSLVFVLKRRSDEEVRRLKLDNVKRDLGEVSTRLLGKLG